MPEKSSPKNRNHDVGIVLLHGFTGTPAIFKELVEEAAADGYTLYTPLLAGHGTNPEDLERTRWRDWALDGERVFTEASKNHRHVVLIGASLGALIAALIASEHTVYRLVLIGYPWRIVRQPFIKVIVWLARVFLGMRFYRKSKRLRNDESSVLTAKRGGYNQIPLKSLRQLFLMAEKVSENALSRITCPTLVIQSDKDGVVHKKSGLHVFNKLGTHDKQLVWVHEPHHRLHLGKARGRIYSEIRNFISK